MNTAKKLWTDQTGAVMSAEMVTLGAVAVLGATVGLGVLTDAVNDELADAALAVRGHNQGVTVVELPDGQLTVHETGLNAAQQAVLRQYQAARSGQHTQANPVETNPDGSMVVETAEGRFEIRRVD